MRVRLHGTDGPVNELGVHAGVDLPEHEVAAVEAGAETSLTHATNLDLWMVR